MLHARGVLRSSKGLDVHQFVKTEICTTVAYVTQCTKIGIETFTFQYVV